MRWTLPERGLDLTGRFIGHLFGLSSHVGRTYLEAAVATDLAVGHDGDLLIPLADAIRALTGLRSCPDTAA